MPFKEVLRDELNMKPPEKPKAKKKLTHADFFLALESFGGASENINSRSSFAPWSPMLA